MSGNTNIFHLFKEHKQIEKYCSSLFKKYLLVKNPHITEISLPINIANQWTDFYIYQSINQSIKQTNVIYFTVHKCMLKNLQDYLGNKAVFVQVGRKSIITCGNLNCKWKLLVCDSRGYLQQLNH